MKKASRDARSSKFKSDPGKQKCQEWHAKKRARERLGIDLTDELTAQIISCIKKEKENPLFKIRWIEDQSKRVGHYELTFEGKEPVMLVYDRFRSTIVTFLFPEDAQNVYHFYDIFSNKVSLKHEIGKIGKLEGDSLAIPGETFEYVNGKWYCTEGLLEGRVFKLNQYGELQEIMNDRGMDTWLEN